MPEISRDDARKLVGRFSEFAPPPALNEGLSQTIDTLIRSARSLSHARRIVEAILESPGGSDKPGEHPRWPTSERIRKVAWDLLTDADRAIGCDRCNGLGFISFVRDGYDYAKPCSCRPKPPADPEPKKQSVLVKAGALAESWVK